MTEREKLEAGLLFCPTDPELKAIKLRTHKLSQDYNRLYEDETEAAETFNKSYEFGEDYSVVSPTIEGYTADELSIGGYADGYDVEKTVTYTKNPEVVEETEEEEEPFTAKDAVPIIILVVLLVGIAVAAVLIIRSQKKAEAKGTTVRKNDPKNNKKKK